MRFAGGALIGTIVSSATALAISVSAKAATKNFSVGSNVGGFGCGVACAGPVIGIVELAFDPVSPS